MRSVSQIEINPKMLYCTPIVSRLGTLMVACVVCNPVRERLHMVGLENAIASIPSAEEARCRPSPFMVLLFACEPPPSLPLFLSGCVSLTLRNMF